MGFTSALATLLATIPTLTFALAVPDTYSTYPTPFCSVTGPAPYNGYTCVWGNSYPPGALECTCNISPPPLPGPQYELAIFYTGDDYTGFQYNAYGGYNTCYDLPFLWNGIASSMKIGWDTPGCWVYTQPDCQGPYDVVGSAGVAEFTYPYGNGVKSFQCDPQSPPPPPPSPPPPVYDPTTTSPKSSTAPPKSSTAPPESTTAPLKSTSTPQYDSFTTLPKSTSTTPKYDPTSTTPKPTTTPPKSTSTPNYDPVPTTTSPKSTPKPTTTLSPYYV